jgi:fructosamine-3-kinase
VSCRDGAEYFCKTDPEARGLLQSEYEALEVLRHHGALRVPQPILGNEQVLVMEFIQAHWPSTVFWQRLGEGLARLHRSSGPWGWPKDNFIGRTPQYNLWDRAQGGWPHFFWERRLLPQIETLRSSSQQLGLHDKLLQQLEERCVELLSPVEELPSLVHGDLWSGNIICGPGDEPFLIDPSLYYGHRETDLAMTQLFGGFGRDFYQAYSEAWHLRSGHESRLPLYQLYHILNHANLYGLAYHRQVVDRITSLVQ